MKNDNCSHIRKIGCFAMFLLLIANVGYAQTQWTKYPENPVLSNGAQASCILDDDTVKMWYASAYGGVSRIKAAWSADGVNWVHYNDGNPVLPLGSEDEWDRDWHDTPEILKDNEGYKLYFYGDSTTLPISEFLHYDSITCAFGVAYSNNGSDWTKHEQNPFLTKGDSTDYDGRWIESPTVCYDEDNSVYNMFYASVGWMWNYNIPMAFSVDGFYWEKYQDNPVIGKGPELYDLSGVSVPSVIKTGDVFEMWYSAMPAVDNMWDSIAVGYAVSLDGIHWIKYPGNPVYDNFYPPFNPENDSSSSWAPEVVFVPDSNSYFMFYDGASGIQLATSPRNVLYSDDCNITVSGNVTIQEGESVNLHATGGDYYLWGPETGLDNASIPNPLASPDETTTYNVLVVGEDCITNAEVTVTVESTHVNTGQISEGINMHPNPATQSLDVIIDDDDCENSQIGIYTLSGKLVKYIDNIKSVNTRINMSSVKPGVYVVILSCSDAIKGYEKIVVIDE